MQKYKGLILLAQIVALTILAYISAWMINSGDKGYEIIGGMICLVVVAYLLMALWKTDDVPLSESLSKLHKRWGWFCSELGASILSYGLTKRGEGLHVYPGELLRTAFNEGWSMRGDNYQLVNGNTGEYVLKLHTYDGPDEAWFNSEVRDIVTKPETTNYQAIKAADDSAKEAQIWANDAALSAHEAFTPQHDPNLDEPLQFAEAFMAAPLFVNIGDDTWINPHFVVSVDQPHNGVTRIMTEDRLFVVHKPIQEVLDELQGVQCSDGCCS